MKFINKIINKPAHYSLILARTDGKLAGSISESILCPKIFLKNQLKYVTDNHKFEPATVTSVNSTVMKLSRPKMFSSSQTWHLHLAQACSDIETKNLWMAFNLLLSNEVDVSRCSGRQNVRNVSPKEVWNLHDYQKISFWKKKGLI